MVRAVLYLRLVPATVWLITQIAMVGAVAPAQAEPAELRMLAKILQVDRLALCNEGENTGVAFEQCPWCQGFADTLLPDAPSAVQSAQCCDPKAPFLARDLAIVGPAGLDYVSRAPPV